MGLDDAVRLADYEPLDWGAQGEGYGTWNPDRNTNQSFVHWGGTPVSDGAVQGDIQAEMSQLRSWEKYHMRNGWRLLAYDFAVGNSGKIYLARGYSRSGAQIGDVDLDGTSNNDEAEAIVVLIGKGQTASSEALSSLARLLEILGYDEVYAHRESAQRGSGTATACPGDQLMEFVRQYRGGSFESDNSQHGRGGAKMFVRKDDKGRLVHYWQKKLKRINRGALPKFGADGHYGDETAEWIGRVLGLDPINAIGSNIAEALEAAAARAIISRYGNNVHATKKEHNKLRRDATREDNSLRSRIKKLEEDGGQDHQHEAKVILE